LAEAEYTTTAKLPVDLIWSFVEEMDNWARFVTGYQSHEKRSDTESIWTLKGDVGVLARKLVFQVEITEWSPGKRAAFRLNGLNEAMNGDGVFTLEPATARGAPVRRRAGIRWPAFFEVIARGLLRLRAAPGARPPRWRAGTRLSFRCGSIRAGRWRP
jgi:carbon monoxide dehydrogenase subunit G